MSDPPHYPAQLVLRGVHLIRPALRTDLDAIVALWRALQEVNAGFEPRLAMNADAPFWFREFLQQQLENASAAVFVAEDFGRVIGYIIGQVHQRPTLKLRKCGYIVDICVAPEQRHHGFGRALVSQVRAWFSNRGVTAIEVQAVSANPVSQAFWKAMGFGEFLLTLRTEA